MSHIPSWRGELHPRKCADCGKSCWNADDWSRYVRELCHGCLEMFCKQCAEKHHLFGKNYSEGPTCGKGLIDYDHLQVDKPGLFIPGWKVAFIQKHLPGALVPYHCTHTAGWHMHFFLNTKDPDAGTLDRELMETLCEGLHASWTAWPVSAVKDRYKDAEIPEEAENGIMVVLENICP